MILCVKEKAGLEVWGGVVGSENVYRDKDMLSIQKVRLPRMRC